MNSKTRYWRFERGGFADLEPPDVDQPPMLFLAPTEQSASWIAVMPPVDAEDFQAFDAFLSDVANAANEMRRTVQRGERALVKGSGCTDGGDEDGLGDART